MIPHIQAHLSLHLSQRHPFIVYLAGTFQTPRTCTLVLEPVDSPCDLWTLIYGTDASGGTHSVAATAPRDTARTQLGQMALLNPTLVRFYAASVAAALSHLHAADMAHRNLKPENVLIDRTGHIRLVGFGCSKRFPYHHTAESGEGGVQAQASSSVWLMSKTYTVCGSAEYMAPETVLVNGHGPAVDAWALGVLLVEMLTGTSPFLFAARASSAAMAAGVSESVQRARHLVDALVMAAVAEVAAAAKGSQVPFLNHLGVHC